MTLQSLVEAIMTSVSEAQDEIEKQNIHNISRYFDGDGKPETVKVLLPSMHNSDGRVVQEGNTGQDEDKRYDPVEIPLLSLLQVNPIKIKEMAVNFKISMDALEQIENDSPVTDTSDKANNLLGTSTSKAIKNSRKKRLMSTELLSNKFFGRGKDRNAEVKITFESGEPPEGYLKLNSHLLKLF